MKENDVALTVTNPRLIAAVYFGLLSVVGTILIDAFLTLIGIEEIIPVFEAILIGVVVSSCTAALFGEHIVHCKAPFKGRVFVLGFIMVIASLPVFDLGLVACMIIEKNATMLGMGLLPMLHFYLGVLAYSYVLFGGALAVASGLAALYLRSQLVYDILHTYEETEIEKQMVPVHIVEKKSTKSRQVKKTA